MVENIIHSSNSMCYKNSNVDHSQFFKRIMKYLEKRKEVNIPDLESYTKLTQALCVYMPIHSLLFDTQGVYIQSGSELATTLWQGPGARARLSLTNIFGCRYNYCTLLICAAVVRHAHIRYL